MKHLLFLSDLRERFIEPKIFIFHPVPPFMEGQNWKKKRKREETEKEKRKKIEEKRKERKEKKKRKGGSKCTIP